MISGGPTQAADALTAKVIAAEVRAADIRGADLGLSADGHRMVQRRGGKDND